MKRQHRVLLCDDSVLVRAGLKEVLKHEADIQVVGEASGGQAGIQAALDLRPDLVLMDVTMPEVDGIEATRQIVAAAPGVKVLGYSAERSWAMVRQMLTAGARGYVLKQHEHRELICAIRSVLAGGLFLSPGLIGASPLLYYPSVTDRLKSKDT
jgi:LuxR family maltose regulon positive regulatory protein